MSELIPKLKAKLLKRILLCLSEGLIIYIYIQPYYNAHY